jgi:hypothetical protein
MKHFLILSFALFAPLQSSLFALSSGGFTTLSLTGGNSAPQVAVALNGAAFAAWVNFASGGIQTAFFNGSGWTLLGTLAFGTVPRVGIDQNGNAIIVWVSSGSATAAPNQILAARFAASSMTFSTPVILSGGGTVNSFPLLAVSSSGVALAIWSQNTPFVPVVAASFNGSNWSVPVPNFLPTLPSSFGLNSVGHGVAVWQDFTGTIQSATISAP